MTITEITSLVLSNQDTIVEVLKQGWVYLATTSIGASIVVAVTKTRDNAFYKLLEAIALTVLKAKDSSDETK